MSRRSVDRVVYFVACIALLAVWWGVEVVGNTVAIVNNTIVNAVCGPPSRMSSIDLIWDLSYAGLLALEILSFAGSLSFVVRHTIVRLIWGSDRPAASTTEPTTFTGGLSMRAIWEYLLRVVVNVLLFMNSVSSFVMAFYAYVVLWGDIRFLIIYIPKYDPPQVSFTMAIWWIALPGMLHIFFEVMGPLIRAPGNVAMFILSLVTSLPSIGVIGWAVLSWAGNSYEPSLFQWGALVAWTPVVTIEILVAFGIGARLLQRSAYYQGDIERIGGHAHGR